MLDRSRAQAERSLRREQMPSHGMETQARTASASQTARQTVARVPLTPATGFGGEQPGKPTRFQEVENDSTFYFPNDPERRYRWVKISPTMARNLVNGRTGVLPVGMTIIPAGTESNFSGFGGEERNLPQEPGKDSSAGYNTLRVTNPNEYSAQVDLRSGSQTANLSVAAHSTGSVQLPDGTYQVLFQFSDQPGRRFQGDDVSLHGNIAEIQLVNVLDGNYGLRPVN